jgi:hypothetical protein
VRGRWALGALVVVLASSAGAVTAEPEAAATHQAAAARLMTLTVATDTDEDVTPIVRGDGEVLAPLCSRRRPSGEPGTRRRAGLEARFADAKPAAATTLARPQSVRELAVSLRSALRFDLRVEGPLNLLAALTLDLLPLQGGLAVSDAGATRPLFTPRPLRPGALAGASFAF